MTGPAALSGSEEETERLGEALAPTLAAGDLVSLEGPLGAGKTRFVAGLARGLGCGSRVRSPSFTLVNEYAGRILLVHLDLYRVEPAECEDLGLDEYLERGAVVVEWGEKLPPARRAAALRLAIVPVSATERCIEAAGAPSGRALDLLRSWRQRAGIA